MTPVRERLTPRFRPVQARRTPPCQMNCPNGSDIRRWIGIVAQRHKLGLSREEAYAAAWRTITDVNPFPSVLGRVCPHPCESPCNRSALDEPMSINAMERFLGDRALAERLPLERLEDGPKKASIGVIGAGPSGLSFAYQLARRNYRVTVYEGRPRPGGMLRYGIPDYRLPPSVLDAEIQRIVELGVELKLDTQVGTRLPLEAIRERHAALYLGIGAQKGRGLEVPGEAGPSVWSGVEYLRQVNSGESIDLGRDVVVVGGGNTAVDAARMARRTGARVTLLYRRSRAEMPALEHEVEDALEEGVALVLQAAPVRLERNGVTLTSLAACRMALGEPDASGRRRPSVIPDSEFAIAADAVIAAVSQEADTSGFESVGGNGGRLRADDGGAVGEGLWAGGDALGLGIASRAIAQGRLAAEALDRRLHGASAGPTGSDGQPTIGPERIMLDFHEKKPSARPARLVADVRLASPTEEVTAGLEEEAFLGEAGRCLSCGSCFGCGQCAMFCTTQCYRKLERIEPGAYYALSLDRCEECGKCAAVCPCGFVTVDSELVLPPADADQHVR